MYSEDVRIIALRTGLQAAFKAKQHLADGEQLSAETATWIAQVFAELAGLPSPDIKDIDRLIAREIALASSTEAERRWAHHRAATELTTLRDGLTKECAA